MSNTAVSLIERWRQDADWDDAADWIAGKVPSELGGPGSGHHGHKGIKGHQGGSAPDLLPDVKEALDALAPDAGEHHDTLQEINALVKHPDSDPFDEKSMTYYERWVQDTEEVRLNTPDVAWAIAEYTNGRYKRLNAAARDPANYDLDMWEQKASDGMDTYFDDKNCLASENLVVYRGTNLNLNHKFDEQALDQIRQKWADPTRTTIFRDPGFFSTTMDEWKADSFRVKSSQTDVMVKYVIAVPKGTNCAPLFNPDYSEEMEVAFPRYSKFEVLKVKPEESTSQGANDVYTVFMKAIP